jgi:hypothetical protein
VIYEHGLAADLGKTSANGHDMLEAIKQWVSRPSQLVFSRCVSLPEQLKTYSLRAILLPPSNPVLACLSPRHSAGFFILALVCICRWSSSGGMLDVLPVNI